jgi:excinuclease UvrABC ATPase subunit
MEAPARQQGLPLVLAEIISSARRRAGVSALSDDSLRSEIRDWMRILEAIPAERIEECNIRAVRSRTVKALLQPQELIAAWSEMRQEQSNRRAISLDPSPNQCYYCDGTGWQVLVTHDENLNQNQSLRECACSSAPPRTRSEFPKREPHWQRDEFGRWMKAS